MSARTRIRDILRRFHGQNVHENPDQRHFVSISPPKCPRETLSWTFCVEFKPEMSSRTRIRDILRRFHAQNVHENPDQRHFVSISPPKCPREHGSETF